MMQLTWIIKDSGVDLDKNYKKAKFKMPNKIAFTVALMCAENASAAIVLENAASVRVGTEYHSNIQLLPDNLKESTFLTSIIPEYRLSALDDKNKWFGKVGIFLTDSSNSDIMRNRQDPYATVGWERILESGIFKLGADYTRESTRISQFSQTGLVAQDGTSVFRSIDGSWLYNVSEKWALLTDASYNENRFSDVAGNLNDFSTRNLGTTLKYSLNEKVSPYVRVAAHDFRSSEQAGNVLGGSSRIRYQDYLVGAEVEMSPRFNFNLYTGIVNVESTASDVWVGQIETSYIAERYELNGKLGRELFPIGLNQLLLQDVLSVNYKYFQTARSWWGIDAEISQNDLGLDTQELRGTYLRELSQHWSMSLSLASRNFKPEGAQSAIDHTLGVFFIYTTPQF